MAYTDDAVKAKLSALNETQESIVTVAQWVMFHRYGNFPFPFPFPVAKPFTQLILSNTDFLVRRRHADRTATLWLQRLKDSGSNKRLNLIYLANEVAQQSRVRKKDDFIIAFSPILAEATAIAYKGATNEVQQKLRRVVEVWRQRVIFEPTIQEAVEARIDGKLQAYLELGHSLFIRRTRQNTLFKQKAFTRRLALLRLVWPFSAFRDRTPRSPTNRCLQSSSNNP